MNNLQPEEGGRRPRAVVLARAGGDETGLR